MTRYTPPSSAMSDTRRRTRMEEICGQFREYNTQAEAGTKLITRDQQRDIARASRKKGTRHGGAVKVVTQQGSLKNVRPDVKED